MDRATGRLTGDQTLPAYYGGAAGVMVSVRSPRGATAAGADMVFVDPQLNSSDIAKAFVAHRSGATG